MNETRLFAEKVVAGIIDYFPEEKEMQCRVIETMKNNNVSRVGISFHEQGSNISPVIYMEPYRKAATNGRPMDDLMREIAETVSRSMEQTQHLGPMDYGDYERVKDYLSVTLINGRENRQLLSQMPYRQMEDLALILELKFPMEQGTGSIKVNHELAERWKVDTDILFEQAERRAMKAEPAVLQKMEDVLSLLETDRNETKNLLDAESLQTAEPGLYVLSNQSKVKGAAVLSYPGVLEKVDRLFPKGFYILPSSVHELLIVPKSPELDPKELGEMVRAINRSEVAKEEQLSDRVYTYDRKAGKIRQVPESVKQKEVREAAR
jgi:hypothetical protein